MSRPPRPTGVTILIILELIGGILFLLLGAILLAVGGSSILAVVGYGPNSGLVAVVGGVVLLFGVLAVVVGLGMWTRKGWAWTLAVVLYGLGVVVSLINIAVGRLSEIISLVIDLLIIWYLWKPHVRAYFGKGVATAPPVQVTPTG